MRFGYTQTQLAVNDLKANIVTNFISDIIAVGDREFLISFSHYRKEKLLLSLNHQNPFLCLYDLSEKIQSVQNKIVPILRRELLNSYIKDISMLNNDRIVCFTLSKTNDFYEKEERKLIIELIPRSPNLLILKENDLIKYVFSTASLESKRPLMNNLTYILPENSYTQINEEGISLKDVKLFVKDFVDLIKEKQSSEISKNVLDYIKSRTKSLNKKMKVLETEIQKAKVHYINLEYGNILLALSIDPDELKTYIKENNIEYDEKVSVGQNANKYFNRYKKAKRTVDMDEVEINKAKQELENLAVISHQLTFMDKQDIDELEVELGLKKAEKKAKNPAKLSYITYKDTKIYFGKNAKQNDSITFKIAKKNNFYFHIKNYHGSHVVVMAEKLNKNLMLLAAEICLILSDKSVGDVLYTEVKNVKRTDVLGYVNMLSYKEITLHDVRESTYKLLKDFKN